MKHLLALALCAIMLCAAVSSYAWVCTYRGPYGRVYSADGGGYGRDEARMRALAACRAGKVHNGVPCEFMGCVAGVK